MNEQYVFATPTDWNALLTDITTLGTAYANGTDVTTAYGDAQARLTAIMETLQAMDSTHQAAVRQQAEQWTTQTVTSSLKPEQMLDAVQRVCRKMLANETANLPLTDWDALLDIAHTCPLEGGPAVYKARALYRLYDREITFTDDCAGNQALRQQTDAVVAAQAAAVKSATKDDGETMLKVWPNPADGNLQLSVTGHTIEYIQIHNSFGQTVQTVPLKSKTAQLSITTTNWQAGMYMIIATDENGQILAEQKLIIVH